MKFIDEWLLEHLRCPQDKKPVDLNGSKLRCSDGHQYSVIDGVPVMLFDDGKPTHGYITRSLDQVAKLESGAEFSAVIPQYDRNDHGVDSFVEAEIPYTCGNLYFAVHHKLPRYPIPRIPLPQGLGRRLLDVGCNWGRWSVAAAQLGYRTIGIDPCLEATFAAGRVARQLGLDAHFVVADARYIPFADESFDTSFSNGVLQHLKKSNARECFREMSRVTVKDGSVVVQMPNKFGILSFYRQLRLGRREPKEGAEVFYWAPSELLNEFTENIGSTKFSSDCYFGLNMQASDLDLYRPHHRLIAHTSELLRKLSRTFPILARSADSVYLHSKKEKDGN